MTDLKMKRKRSPVSPLTAWYNGLRLERRRTIMGYTFIMPFILGFFLWWLIPALVAAYLSFHRWNLISPPRFIGLDNFERLLNDPLILDSLKATFIYTATSVPIGLVFAFFLAILINTKIRGIAIFRTIYYLPTIVPLVASALLWAWILNTEFGLLNVAIRGLGGARVAWLQEPESAMASFIIMSMWSVGGPMIIFLAGLQGIPDVYYEAADIDGAGRVAKLRYITIPLMSPIIFFNLVIGLIGAAQEFVRAYLITGGDPENSTLFLVLYIYRTAFESQRMGYAAVLSWVLFIILMILSYLIFRYLGSRVYYESPGD